MKVLSVVGARPNFMKVAPILKEMARFGDRFSTMLVHTGQHYDERMSGAFFRDLGMRPPDIDLGVGSGTHAAQTARVMLAFEPVLESFSPDWVVVVGDVNSTLACALVAAKLHFRIAHVEAGLRSFDWRMPEEVNRVLTDRLADLLLTPSEDADRNLAAEGIGPDRIVRVGNVMIDTLFDQLERADNSTILSYLSLDPGSYAVLTLHRPANVDDPEKLRRISSTIGALASRIPVVFPVHPRTRTMLDHLGITLPAEVITIEPLGYLDFLRLWSQSRLVLTDSGGLQEETTALAIPCLTLRDETERPITLEMGSNRLVGSDPGKMIDAVDEILARGTRAIGSCSIPLWDGKSAGRIIEALTERL